MEKCVESALTVKGQATIPKAVRRHLRLKPGDRVKFFIHPDGSVVLLPKLGPWALRGMIRQPARAVTLRQMDKAMREGAGRPPQRAGAARAARRKSPRK